MGGGQSNMLSMFVTVSKVISNGFVWYTVRGRTLDQNWVERPYILYTRLLFINMFFICIMGREILNKLTT